MATLGLIPEAMHKYPQVSKYYASTYIDRTKTTVPVGPTTRCL